MSKPLIRSTGIRMLSNVHRSFHYPVEDVLTIENGTSPDLISGYNDTTLCIQQLLADAISKNKTLRVMGGNWSWTKNAFADDWVINTLRLQKMKRLLPEELLNTEPFVQDRFLFSQCGCSIQQISRALQGLGRSLKTTGASNGQTIVGAVSNNTHGSAIDFGSTPDYISGMHIVVAPDRHVYLERSSRPVVSDVFINKIGAEHIKDDELFNAALVSFGSFGFIHGMMIETDPLFLLQVFRDRYSMQDVQGLMNTLDFSNTPFLPKPGERPFHFQVLVNPYDHEKGPYINTMYRMPYRNDYPRTQVNWDEAGPGEDAPVMIGKITSRIPMVTPLVVNNVIKQTYKKIEGQWGTHGEIFTNSDTQGRVLSAAIGIAVQDTTRVNQIALDLNKKEGAFVGVFAYRYVKQTAATMGFTHFSPTCIAEFDSVEAPSTYKFYEALWKELEIQNIPFTFHWGKINNLNAISVKKKYGEKCDRWMEARNRLLSPEMIRVFNNPALGELGLDKIIAFA